MCTSKSREAKCFWRVAEDPVSDIQHHKPSHLGFILQTSIDVTEGCALQGLSRGASAVIKDYMVVPTETESQPLVLRSHECVMKFFLQLVVMFSHPFSPAGPFLISQGWGLPPASILSVYHPSVCLHMHIDYGICVELRAQLYGIGSSLYLDVHPGDQT